PGQRRSNGDTVVRALEQTKLESQNEVCVLLGRKQVSTAVGGADQKSVLDPVAGALLANNLPAGERFAVKQGHEARLGAGCRYGQHDRQQSGYCFHHYRKFTTTA